MNETAPFIIDIKTKNEEEAEKLIYAFNTKTPFESSLAEIKRIITKLGGKGFQYTEHPQTSAQSIRFVIRHGDMDLPIQIDIPRIFLTTDRKPRHLLDKIGIRLTILELKVKLFKLAGQKKNVLMVLSEYVLTKSGVPLGVYLTQGSNAQDLLPERT